MIRRNIKNKIVLFVILHFILFCFGSILVKSNDFEIHSYDYVEQDINCIMQTEGYDIVGDKYYVISDDPKLFISLLEFEEVYGIELEFEHTMIPINFQVYWASENGVFEEENSILKKTNKENVCEVKFFNSIQNIRIDINDDFELKGINIITNRTSNDSINIKHYIIVFILCFVISIFLSVTKIWNRVSEKIIKSIKNCFKTIYNNRKTIIFNVIYITIAIAVSIILEVIIFKLGNKSYYNRYRAYIIFSTLLIIISIKALWNLIPKRPDILFAVVALTIGITNIIASPRAVGLSWDDEIHFKRAVYMSYGAMGYISYADNEFINGYTSVILNKKINYSNEGRKNWNNYINEVAKKYNHTVNCDYELSLHSVAYIPAALGLSLARGIGLKFTHMIMVGKVFNLLFYTLVLSYSIKLLKNRGKLFVCVLGLLPTTIFIASSFSYDWWVLSISILAYSILSKLVHEPTKTISIKNWTFITVIMVIAFLPKAVYFLMLFPMTFIARKKFSKNKKEIYYWLINLTGILFLVGTFLLPMLINGAGEGDLRGGEGVNSTEQINFILSQPITYSKIVLNHIKEYISLDNASDYTNSLAYIGKARYHVLCMIIMIMSAFVDGTSRENKTHWISKIIVLLSVLSSVVLVSTALYISYTPVGNTGIGGCQPRYLLPLVFPVGYYLLETNISIVNVNKKIMYSVAVFTLSLVFIINMYNLMVCKY